MYVKSSTRHTARGPVRYLQLAHNEWDPAAGVSRTKVLYSFGREDQLDRAAVQRLVAALSKLLSPEQALAAGAPAGLAFTESRPLGGAFALDGLWRRLGIDDAIRSLLARRRIDEQLAERVIFALVANRALAPSSKLAATGWIAADVAIDGLDGAGEDACYRAMDALLGVEDALAKRVYDAVADLLNLEVDLLFFDTTSTYFETDEPNAPVARDERGRALDPEAATDGQAPAAGFRRYGKSKDHRDDLPQVVIGMAVTRTGIPVRVWCWPGNTADSALIRQVKDDLRDWTLARIVWVADRGFASAENRRYLQRAGGHYLLGERLRSGSAEAAAALTRPGRYRAVADNLQVKEVRLPEDIGTGDRFVVCFNPEAAERDRQVRERLVAALEDAIGGSDKLTATKRAELRGQLSTKPGLHRYLKTTPGGLLRMDKAAIAAETKLDGKFLLRSSDPKLTAEDIALGYKQLLTVERGWRDMKQLIDLRPVYHRREDRIRAHVLLCWLALLLIRIIETTTGRTWTGVRAELQRLHVGTFTGPAGTFRQRTELTTEQQAILGALGLPAPPRILTAAPAAA
ncbi:IS1634 family transposase [Geodermatophilus sp. YIM 151500]|uniref:IS1634 family transposase n=1 Tax=Geodermatophilus sp. YIM 151500 TaxID=2984531 RepID=UPI0021E3CAE2|nr:IS1634 family transposase [Geodermatophilus sp. YIM 151500]MCV2491895.1 IS1634 family transposase [Geodermatophilus sp. YIM 151500]